MPEVAIIELFERLDKVTFYTIRLDEEEDTETDKFIARFFNSNYEAYEEGFKEDLDDILNWINEIGNRGIQICSLRHEGKAEALPPKFRSNPVEFTPIDFNRLRLYCIKLNARIIILLGGGIKTSQKAQDSPDLSMKLIFAGKISSRLTQKIRDNDIIITDSNLEGDMDIWI